MGEVGEGRDGGDAPRELAQEAIQPSAPTQQGPSQWPFWAGAFVALLAAVLLLAGGTNFIVGAFLGALLLAGLEGAAVVLLWRRIGKRAGVEEEDLQEEEAAEAAEGGMAAVGEGQQDGSALFAQGLVWITTQLPRPLERSASQKGEPNVTNNKGSLARQDSKRTGNGGSGRVLPQKRTAKLEGSVLELTTAVNGRTEVIVLAGCEVKVLSGNGQSERKWSRKYPIRIRHPSAPIWGGSSEIYLYLASGQLKEAWSVLLRAAAQGSEGESRQASLKKEFSEYTHRVRDLYDFWHDRSEIDGDPMLVESTEQVQLNRHAKAKQWLRKRFSKKGGPGSASGRMDAPIGISEEHQPSPKHNNNNDNIPKSSSQERLDTAHLKGQVKSFFRRASSRARRGVTGQDNTAEEGRMERVMSTDSIASISEEGNNITTAEAAATGMEDAEHAKPSVYSEDPTAIATAEPMQNINASNLSTGVAFPGAESGGSEEGSLPEGMMQSLPEGVMQSAAEEMMQLQAADVDSEDGETGGPRPDNGCQWVNALWARIFFDLYRSPRVNEVLRGKIQAKLARVKTPAYMGSINCTHFSVGNVPPLARSLRVVSAGRGGAIALEADLEYYGGATLAIETRLDMRELAFLQEKGTQQSATVEEEGEEGEEELAPGLVLAAEGQEVKDRAGQESKPKGFAASSFMRGVRAMMSHVADHVSQVPLTLHVTVGSLKGKARYRIAAPPSDRIWFGFVEMPEIDLQSHPQIGEIRLNYNAIASWLVERIKGVIKDSIVLPQSTDIHFSMMAADHDDLAEGEVPPVPWSAPNLTATQASSSTNCSSVNEHSVDNLLRSSSLKEGAPGAQAASAVANSSFPQNSNPSTPQGSAIPQNAPRMPQDTKYTNIPAAMTPPLPLNLAPISMKQATSTGPAPGASLPPLSPRSQRKGISSIAAAEGSTDTSGASPGSPKNLNGVGELSMPEHAFDREQYAVDKFPLLTSNTDWSHEPPQGLNNASQSTNTPWAEKPLHSAGALGGSNGEGPALSFRSWEYPGVSRSEPLTNTAPAQNTGHLPEQKQKRSVSGPLDYQGATADQKLEAEPLPRAPKSIGGAMDELALTDNNAPELSETNPETSYQNVEPVVLPAGEPGNAAYKNVQSARGRGDSYGVVEQSRAQVEQDNGHSSDEEEGTDSDMYVKRLLATRASKSEKVVGSSGGEYRSTEQPYMERQESSRRGRDVMGFGRIMGSKVMDKLKDKESREKLEGHARRALGFLQRDSRKSQRGAGEGMEARGPGQFDSTG